MKRTIGIAAISLAAAIASTASTLVAAEPANAAPPYLAAADDPAVTTLANDLDISIEQARGRIGVQEPAIQLADELSRSLGEGFGGLWFDTADRGRIKVALVESAPTHVAQSTIDQWGLTSVTDTVRVRHSHAQLRRDSAWLGGLIAAANRDGVAELSFATQVDRNRLVLRTPADAVLTAAQHEAIEAATTRLGSRLVLQRGSTAIERQACAWVLARFTCDAPLRGGVKTYINVNTPQCTTAFNARSQSDGRWYVLTAGHCGGIGTEMRAYQPSTGAHHVIGDVHNRSVAGNDDYAIVRVNNVPGWNPQNWVYVHASGDTVLDPDYTITGVSTSPVGTRVCISGANSGTDCGDVVETDWNGPNGLARAEYCSQSGDSGAAIYSNHRARGIHIGVVAGHSGDCHNALFQGVTEAADELNVNVVTS